MNVGKYDVVALGELLIDFTDAGQSNQGNPQYEANPGGAPCNVLSMLAKLGIGCAFIGKVGKDSFGRQLRAFESSFSEKSLNNGIFSKVEVSMVYLS